jgi:hypothetical protein
MFPPLQPLQLLLVIFAGWVNGRQLDVIDIAHPLVVDCLLVPQRALDQTCNLDRKQTQRDAMGRDSCAFAIQARMSVRR